ncbi:hypothetical protein [Domibacillus tundrae]|uniref:hypothetical protein n=1 Tax=Domibacillus tundrae TaxID=1587527 RepID=UPI000617D728|nr:hypothetical protein [Domibacillus tundrae]
MSKRHLRVVQQEDSSLSSAVNASKLDVVVSGLVTFADAIAALSALMALDAVTNSDSQDQSNSEPLQKQLAAMKKKLIA